jgi:thymidylate synthase (FAD)
MHVETLVPKKHPYRILFGQRCLTHFKDYRSAISVDLIYSPPREVIMPAVYDFVKATWSETGKESIKATLDQMSEALSLMLEGKALGLGIETIDFIFRINGITRIDTHQIVRNRIGITYSQQCTGDRFLNHTDVLVEENLNQPGMEHVLQDFIDATLATKQSYASMVDSLKVSIQTAREITPHNLETFIFVKINLMTLLQFYKKRIDDGSQTWPINIVAQKMAEESCKVYPELKTIFDKMKTSYKFQTEASKDRENTFSTSLYIPKNDNEFDYHDRDFLYQQKKEEMNYTNTPIDNMYYWGKKKITKQKYDLISKMYDKLNIENEENHNDNLTILTNARKINEVIESDILI